MKLIGLTGPAGAGKDSVADVLCKDHGFVRYEFARPLKAMLNVIGVACDDRALKELPHPLFGKSPRRMAQTLGTEWMRELVNAEGWLLLAGKFIDDVWRVKSLQITEGERLERPAARRMWNAKGIVITDCRFQNEAAFIAERGGVIWHIERPGVAAVEAHSSESGLERLPGDLVIPNMGPLKMLPGTVGQAMAFPHFYTVPYDGQITGD